MTLGPDSVWSYRSRIHRRIFLRTRGVEQGRDPDFAGGDLKVKLVTAVEELNEPATTRMKVFAALEAAVAEPRVPPKRSFRQGEI